MRAMYDGVDATAVPAGAAIYAGYVDGNWQSYKPLAAKFPNALHASICVSASDSARILDVESGDATPAQAPGWASRQRSAGNPYPVIYTDGANWAAVQAAFSAQGVAPPLYWVASYVSDPASPPAIPAGALAIQYYDYGGYDASLVADYWPGLDPSPSPTPQPTSQEDDEMTTTSVAGRAGLSWAAGAKHVVQVGYDPAGGDPTLRMVLVLASGPLVVPQWTFTKGLGTGVYQLPKEHIAACRGVILEWASGSAQVTYDATAV